LAKEDSSEEIKDAIKNIMGLEVLERAKRHIKSAKRNFRKEMEKHENSDELAELNDEQSKYEDNIMQYEDDIRQLKTNKDAANRQLEEINNQLRSKETTSDLQNKRDELEIEKKNNSKELAELKEKICSSISVNGSLALANKVLNESSNFLSDKIDSGEIPAGIKKVFVNELLEREECICGSPLCEGTQEREEVKSWLEKAGDNKLEKIFIDINTMIGTLNERKENFYENLEKLKNNREILKEKRRKIFEKIDEIESELSQKDSEDIQELLKKKNDINENIESISRDIGAFEQKIRDNEKELKDIEKKIEKFEAKKEKSILAQKRVFALNNANKYIEYLHEKNANKVRKKVQDKIKEVFKEFFRKNYSPVLDENYNLRIVKSFSNEERSVPMSRGERQITSISFIGSLVDIAREHMKESSNDLFYTGGIYPIVMDSPFGALDPDHKKRIATGIPSLAKQVIVMATDSQWQDEVNDSMRNKVGEEYFLNNFDPNLDENIENEFTLIERE
jgi:DNA sulfur modification protein DndD